MDVALLIFSVSIGGIAGLFVGAHADGGFVLPSVIGSGALGGATGGSLLLARASSRTPVRTPSSHP